MPNRRAALLVVLGVVFGSGLTALLFLSFFRESSDERREEIAFEQTADSGMDDTKVVAKEPRAPRDISGSCILSGTVRDEEERGIAGALVRVRLLDEPWRFADVPEWTETDDEGRFKIEGLSEAIDYQLWAWTRDRAVASHIRAPCGSATDFRFQRGATLKLAFTKPNREPAGVVSFRLSGSTLWPVREAETDTSGMLTIHGLGDGEYSLWATTDEFAFISEEPIRLERGKETIADIELAPAGQARIAVVDGSGKPPRGEVTVVVGPTTTPLVHQAVSVNRQGVAVIGGLAAGRCIATVLAEGYVPASPVALRKDDDVVIRVERGAAVSGVVRTADGRAVSGASLIVDRDLGGSFVAVPAGRGRSFRARVLQAARAGWPKMYVTPDETTIPGPLHMPLPESTGTKPAIAGATWRLTNEEGRFALDGLPSGRLTIGAVQPEYVLFEAAQLTLEQGGSADEVVVLMRPGSRVEVRTVDEKGYPVREAEIVAYGSNDDRLGSAVSGVDGFATLAGLPGAFRVEATGEDRVPAAADVKGKTGADRELELILPPADKILYGRVTNPNGFGVPGAMVTARAMTRGLIQVLTAMTEADGSFSLEGAGSGAYHVSVDAGGRNKAQVGGAHFDQEIKLVLNVDRATLAQGDGDYVTPQEFAEAVGTPHVESDIAVPENLGVTTGASSRSTDEEESQSGTIETRFGQADELPVTGPPPGKGGLPITVGGGPGNVVVRTVRSGSRVAVAGLSAGDRILEIDGKKTGGPDAARRAIGGKIGTVVMLKVKSADGEVFNVVVQRVRVRAKSPSR